MDFAQPNALHKDVTTSPAHLHKRKDSLVEVDHVMSAAASDGFVVDDALPLTVNVAKWRCWQFGVVVPFSPGSKINHVVRA
jgi:hypothetical protein